MRWLTVEAVLTCLCVSSGAVIHGEGRLTAGVAMFEPCAAGVVAETQADVQSIVKAVYEGDVNVTMKYTHPTVIRLQGGEAAARRALEKAIGFIRQSGLSLESMTFPSAPICLQGKGRTFVIVPTLSIIAAGPQRFESLNFQVGVREPSSHEWKYVEGSRLDDRNIAILFPGFPSSYKLPSIYRKPL